MNEIGKRVIVGNPENIMSFIIVEITDVLEVSQNETYYEIYRYPLLDSPNLSERIKNINL